MHLKCIDSYKTALILGETYEGEKVSHGWKINGVPYIFETWRFEEFPPSPKVGDFGFWNNDRFPYLLCGQITKVLKESDSNGYIETTNFGKGSYFRLKFSLDAARGKELRNKLNKLEEKKDKALKSLEASFQKGLESLLSNYKEAQ